MSEVWLTHPNLPGQDIKVTQGALGTYAQSGWQMRPDQSDPAPDVDLGEVEPPADEPATVPDSTTDDQTDDVPAADTEMEI